MKKNGILNSDIARVLAYMGHTDRICIGDCGLPVPDETERIDLALRFGQPSFMDVLKEVAGDMKIERIVLAEEMKEQNEAQLQAVLNFFEKLETGEAGHIDIQQGKVHLAREQKFQRAASVFCSQHTIAGSFQSISQCLPDGRVVFRH
jgi:D-ribose pyranose/furanose isomerase RbsD